MLSALLLQLALTAEPGPSPLEAAKRHLAAGKLDDVLFDLDGKTFPPAERPAVAAVLAESAHAGLDSNDLVLALQFAQMALRLDKNQPLALETGALASLRQKQFDPAEDYADRLLALKPKAAAPRLLRAEIALEEGEWARVIALTRETDPRELSEADRKRLLVVVQTAMKELGERESGRAEAKTLQTQLTAQMAQLDRTAAAAPAPAQTDRPKVIVYSTAWCGFCKRAKAWLTARNVPFEAKDIETEPDALTELNTKKRAAGRGGQGGVPIIDVGGQLIYGFDVPALERLFPR